MEADIQPLRKKSRYYRKAGRPFKCKFLEGRDLIRNRIEILWHTIRTCLLLRGNDRKQTRCNRSVRGKDTATLACMVGAKIISEIPRWRLGVPAINDFDWPMLAGRWAITRQSEEPRKRAKGREIIRWFKPENVQARVFIQFVRQVLSWGKALVNFQNVSATQRDVRVDDVRVVNLKPGPVTRRDFPVLASRD